MTEEEKKAIDNIKSVVEEMYDEECIELDLIDTETKKIEHEEIKIIDIKKLYNLAEKQAEEIKNWKDTCHSLADEEQLENKIKLFAPSIKALNKLEDGKKEAQFMSKLIKYYKVILKEKKQIYEELKRRNK